MDVVIEIIDASLTVQNDRTLKDVVIKAGEEMGEVMAEVSKLTGHTKYKEGGDNLVEEVADTVIALVDLVMIYGGFTAADKFRKAVITKTNKWKEKYNEK